MKRTLCFSIKVTGWREADGGRGHRQIRGTATANKEGLSLAEFAASTLVAMCRENDLEGQKVAFSAWWKKP